MKQCELRVEEDEAKNEAEAEHEQKTENSEEMGFKIIERAFESSKLIAEYCNQMRAVQN